MENKSTSFRQLITWQKSMELVQVVYDLAKRLPSEEKFGLVSQMTRAAISVPSNIAEGYKRGKKEYGQFLAIALGSLAELETQLEVTKSIYHLDTHELLQACDEIARMLYATRKNLRDQN